MSELDRVIAELKGLQVSRVSPLDDTDVCMSSGTAHPQEIAGRAAKAVLAFEPSEGNKAELDLQTTTDIRTLIMYLRQLGCPVASDIASVYETFVHAARYRVYGETVYDNESGEEQHDRLTRDEPEPDFVDMQSILAASLRSHALLALADPQSHRGELLVEESVARAGQTKPPEFLQARQSELVRATNQVIGDGTLNKGSLSKAITGGKIKYNGQSGQVCRVDAESFLKWIARKKDLQNDETIQIRNAVIGEINSREKLRN